MTSRRDRLISAIAVVLMIAGLVLIVAYSGGCDSGGKPVNGECSFERAYAPDYTGTSGHITRLVQAQDGTSPQRMDTLYVGKITLPVDGGEGVVVLYAGAGQGWAIDPNTQRHIVFSNGYMALHWTADGATHLIDLRRVYIGAGYDSWIVEPMVWTLDELGVMFRYAPDCAAWPEPENAWRVLDWGHDEGGDWVRLWARW